MPSDHIFRSSNINMTTVVMKHSFVKKSLTV